MRLAHQVAAVLGEELIIHPVHRHRHMAASIDVGMELAAEIDQKAFLVGAANRQHELHAIRPAPILRAAHPIAPMRRRGSCARAGARQRGAATMLRRHPICSISTSTVSPGFISPTPDGVPVEITSPGSSVMMWRDEADQKIALENEIRGAAILPHLAVQARGRAQDRRGRRLRFRSPGQAEQRYRNLCRA